MKKIKKTKKNDIQKFLSCFDHAPENKKNSSYHPEIFSHRWDFLNNHYLDSNFFYFLKPPEKSEKFRFLNSKNTKNSKDQIYDQLNFIEGAIKDSYFPRDLIIENLKDENSKLMKNYGNNIVTIPYILSEESYKFILIFPTKEKNALNFMDLEIKDNTQNLGLQIKECVQSPEISIPEIFQMNKQIINDKIYLNLRTSNYILSFPYASNILDSPNETIFSKENFKENIFVSKNYDSELMDMKLSNFFSEQNYILTSKNSIYLLENNRNSLLLDQSTIKQLYFLESSYHPKILYLMSSEQICLFDYRTSKPNILIENQKKERNKFFGIKHYFDQFLLCSTSKHFSFFDIRFPKSPILEFRHFSEENPPSILEFSSFLSDIQPNSTSIQSDIKNIEIIERYNLMDDNQKRVLTAFSADKTGSAIANLIDSNMLKEENWKELIKVIEISQEPSFSFQKYLKGLTPLLLYSLNMRDEKYRISGISCVSLKKRKVNLLFQNDNYGGINLQILSNNTESEDKLRHLTMKFEEKQEFEDYIDLDQLRYDRLFKKTEIKKDKIYLDFSNEFELESDNELEDSNTLNDKNKKFLNFDKIFKKVLRNSLKLKTQNHDNTFRNHAKKIHLNETAEVQQSLESTQMNLEDLIFNQTTDELMKQKTNRENCYNEKSLITKELEEYLKAKWDET